MRRRRAILLAVLLSVCLILFTCSFVFSTRPALRVHEHVDEFEDVEEEDWEAQPQKNRAYDEEEEEEEEEVKEQIHTTREIFSTKAAAPSSHRMLDSDQTPTPTLKATSKAKLKATPKATPKVTPKATPRAKLKATPKATPKAAPKTTPKATPKAIPKARRKAPALNETSNHPGLKKRFKINGAKTQKPVQPPASPAFVRETGVKACTMVRNKSRYILEWIAFHRLQGIERFVIYDDFSTDSISKKLSPFIDSGVVELKTISQLLSELDQKNHSSALLQTLPRKDQLALQEQVKNCFGKPNQPRSARNRCQLAAFMDCVARANIEKDSWVGLFDVDEFFYAPVLPNVTITSVAKVLNDLPSKIHQYHVIGASFGPSGHLYANWTGLLTATHTKRPYLDDQGFATWPPRLSNAFNCSLCNHKATEARKSFLRPASAKLDQVSIHFSEVEGATDRRMGWHEKATVRLNHYQFLSVEESIAKKITNGANIKAVYQSIDDPILQRFLDMVSDPAAKVFAEQVAACMKRTVANMFEKKCLSYQPAKV